MSLVAALTIPPAQALNAVGTSAADRQIVAAGAGSVPSVVYGEAIVTGRVLNVLAAAGGANLVVQVVWALGPIQSIDLPLYKDRALPAGATVTHYLGAAGQTVDATMVSAMAAQSITYTSALPGVAYSVFVVPIGGFDGSLKFTARVRGRLLYDPRKDGTVAGGSGAHRLANQATWEYSDNPALADADWLRSDVYGCGVTVDWVSVIAAANATDAMIGSPAEKRRVIGLEIDTARPVADVAEALRAYAGVWHVHTQASATVGAVKLVPDADASAVASYSHASGQILRFGPLQARDISSAPTAVEVVYTDSSKRPTRDAYARASVPGAGSTLPLRLSQVRLPGITRYSQALREATERLNKLRLGDLTAGIDFLDEGLRHEVGDIINITHPVGVTAKPFRISEPPQLVATGRWRAALVEHDPAVYSTAVQTAPSIPDTALVIGGGRPADWVSLENRPSNLAALAGTEPIQNTQIAVNGAGQITGIGTGAGTAVANTNVSITAAGSLLGAGGGQVSLGSLPGAIAAAQVADGAITTAKFAAGIEPVAIVAGSTVPTTKTTNTIYLAGTSKLYRWDGSAYVTSVPAADVTGQIVAGQVADGAINTAKFAAGIEPVTVVVGSMLPTVKSTNTIYLTGTGKVYRWEGTAYVSSVPAVDVSGQLTSAQIAALDAAKLTGQITSTQITDGAISTPKLAAGSVTTAVLSANAVTAGTIAAGAITTVKLAAGAVTANEIGANAITSDKILANAIIAGKIAAGAIGATELAAGAVTTAKLAANAVTANEIAANAITAGKISTGAVTADKVAANAITAGKIAVGAVSATEIAAGAVTTAKLAANAVTANEIAANAITTGKIAADAVTAVKIDSRGLILRDDAGNITFANGTAKPNLCPNPDLIAGTATTANAWDLGIVGTPDYAIRWLPTGPDITPWSREQHVFYAQTNAADEYVYWMSDHIQIDQTKVYCLSAWVKNYSNGRSYLGLHYYNSSGVEVGFNYPALESQTPPSSWSRIYGTTGPGQPKAIPAGAVTVRIIWIGQYYQVGGTFATRFGFNEGVYPSEAIDFGGVSAWNPITPGNASTYIASAAIGSALISDAAITNAKIASAAIDWAKIQNLLINTSGSIRSGKTGPTDTALGYWIGFDAGQPKLVIGGGAGNRITIDSATGGVTQEIPSSNLTVTGPQNGEAFGAFALASGGASANASLAFNTDGSTSSGSAWYRAVTGGIGSAYWVRFTHIRGNVPGGVGTSWLALSSARLVTLSATNQVKSSGVLWELSTSSTGSPIVASGNINMTAESYSGVIP